MDISNASSESLANELFKRMINEHAIAMREMQENIENPPLDLECYDSHALNEIRCRAVIVALSRHFDIKWSMNNDGTFRLDS